MPGVLIETGFITNPAEEKYLNSEEGQEYIASAIFRAFRDYKIDIESKSGVSFANTALVEYEDSTLHSEAKDSLGFDPPLYFKVQISSSSNEIPLDSDIFKNFTNVEEFKTNNAYKYAVGKKIKYDDIVEYSKLVKNKYPDAFIIAIKNGEIISIQEALHELYNKQN
jgi:N-acetylmuramoyl-L-alanine amidase